MIYATQTMSDCDSLRFSLALPTPRSHLFDREVFCQHYPVLNTIRQFADECAGDDTSEAVCMLVKRQLFAPLLATEESQALLLVHQLPDEYETALAELAVSTVDVFNYPSADLKRYLSYTTWCASRDDQTITEIWLPACLLHDYFSRNTNALGVISGYACQFSPQFHPVLMVSGQTVALGGFWEDEALLFEMQAAEMAASHAPKWGCSPEEQAIAECVKDPTPWQHRVYRESNGRMIEPRGFNFSGVNF